jgi:hypothetical protein
MVRDVLLASSWRQVGLRSCREGKGAVRPWWLGVVLAWGNVAASTKHMGFKGTFGYYNQWDQNPNYAGGCMATFKIFATPHVRMVHIVYR